MQRLFRGCHDVIDPAVQRAQAAGVPWSSQRTTVDPTKGIHSTHNLQNGDLAGILFQREATMQPAFRSDNAGPVQPLHHLRQIVRRGTDLSGQRNRRTRLTLTRPQETGVNLIEKQTPALA